jgi:ATP-binding cassette, subfamily B, multidrug efflux pump
MKMRNGKDDSFMARALLDTAKKSFPHAFMILAAVASGVVINAWPSLVLKRIVDGPLNSAGKGLWTYAFLYLGAVLLLGLSDLMREYGTMVFGQRMLLHIRTHMLERLRILPISYYLDVPAGETISKFTADIDSINTLFTSGIVSTAADILKIAGLVAALFGLSSVLGFIALGSLPVIYLLADYFRKRIYQKQLIIRSRVSDINTGIQEIYAGLKIIKIFGKEKFFAGRFEPLLENHRLAMNANSVYDAWFPCITQTIRAAVIALAVFVGASNNMTPAALGLSMGALAATADLFTRLFDPIEAAAADIQTIQQAMAGLNRIKSFFRQETETVQRFEAAAAQMPIDATVSVENISFAYQKGRNVLSNASLTVPSGTKAAIAGRTGSGKTTLMNLISGLYPPDSGGITIGGIDPYRLPPSARRRLVGIVPQNAVILNGSIHENITLRDDSISREQAEHALQTVGLSDTVRNLPCGMDTVIGEGAAQLSFGQTQLLSLARAIVADPPLLMLDELTSGLDAVTERQVLASIRAVSSGRTIITVSHRLSGLIDADTVHIMERGRIMESGSPQELARKEGWYARYKRLEDYGWKVG